MQPEFYTKRIVTVTALPAVCDPRNGDVCFLTTGANQGLYVATALNTWRRVGINMLTQSVSSGPVVNASAAGAGVKGLYTQLIAALAFQVTMIVGTFEPQAGGGNWLIDLATGAGGAEVVLVPDIFISGVGLAQNLSFFYTIPVGARVAVRNSCAAGGPLNLNCGFTFLG